MDDADLAQARIEADLEWHLAQQRAHRHAAEETPLGTPWTDAAGHRLCLDCGEPIDPLRLSAMPGAIRCVECQATMEIYV